MKLEDFIKDETAVILNMGSGRLPGGKKMKGLHVIGTCGGEQGCRHSDKQTYSCTYHNMNIDEYLDASHGCPKWKANGGKQ